MPQSRYNAVRYNEARYNGGLLSETLSTDLIVFNSYSLHNDDDIVTSAYAIEHAPSREISGGGVPREDGTFLNSEYWRRKVIIVSGHLISDTAANLETLIDAFKKNLRGAEQNLDITRNSEVRRYAATLANPENMMPIREHFHITWIPFECHFECRTPFATDRTYTIISEQITTSPVNITEAENTGTIESLPVIVAIFDAASSVTTLNIQRIDSDGSTLDEIEYNDTIAAGDVLEFDSENKTVKKNGSEVDYTGAFPVLDVGGNILKFTTTGTSFDFITTVKWKNRYL